MSVLNLIRPDLLSIKNYTPGSDNLDCRLHANELPWAPVEIENLALNHYPDSREQRQLKEQMADYYQIKSEELLLTRGSDDAIDFLMRLFLRAGLDSIMQCPPTFPMYAFYAQLQQASVLDCALDAENGFGLSFKQLIALWQPNCKLIMLCQPNNPTGSLLDLTMISKICGYFKDKSVVVVDEAYIDFAQSASATSLLESFDNLIVLRTLSKAYGLAGLRLGAIIAQPQLINAIEKIIPPYHLPSVVIQFAKRALTDKEWFRSKIKLILTERDRMMAALKLSPWVEKTHPSQTNFILISTSFAKELTIWFAESGIAVRHFAASPLQNMIRITVGNEDHNQRLLAALGNFRP